MRVHKDRDASITPTTKGERVRQLRQSHGWTMMNLAQKACVSEGYISRFERDQIQNASAEVLAHLARALNTTLDYLIYGGTPTMHSSKIDPLIQRINENLVRLPLQDREIICSLAAEMQLKHKQRQREEKSG